MAAVSVAEVTECYPQIETRSFPISLIAYPRDFAFYVADPGSSIHTNDYQCSCCSGGLRPSSEIRAIRSQLFFLGTVWKDGIDLSITTHGNLSSRKIAFCGANGVGSSSDAIVKSIVSESLESSNNKCVPQHAANERIRFAYGILRGSPFVTTKSWRGTDPHCT